MLFNRLFILVLGMFFLFQFSYAQKEDGKLENETIKLTEKHYTSSIFPNSLADLIINFGKQYLYAPYRKGASSEKGFDCSGFTSFIFNKFGFKLDHSSSGQANQYPSIQKNELKPGDLVFFNGRQRGKKIGHVGIVVTNYGNGNFDFIHSSSSEGVIVSNSMEPYYSNRYVKAGRVLENNEEINSDFQPERQEYVSNEIPTYTRRTIPAVYHLVKKGETLSSIARKYDTTISELKKINHLSTSKILQKQKLKVSESENILDTNPSEAKANKDSIKQYVSTLASDNNTAKTENIKSNSSVKERQNVIHEVASGESLYSIAKKYSLTVNQLKDANKLTGNKIKPGQKLEIL